MSTNSEPRRVALLITELDVGGAEKCLVRLACGLDRQQFAPEVYALAPPPQANPALVTQLKAAAIPVQFLGVRHCWQFPFAITHLKRQFRMRPPDVVQSFLFHANVTAGWAAGNRWPFVLGVRVADPRGWRLWLEKRAARGARKIVCVSQTVADDLQRRSGLPAERITVIPNGVDAELFANTEPLSLESHGIAADRKVLLFLGRLDRQKGLDWLLEFAPALLKQLPEHDLVLAGQGPWAARVQQAKSDPQFGGRLHWIGWHDNAPGLLSRSDVLLLPSRWEGMPNVILEAMAAGRPVAASSVEGVCELLGEASEPQTFAFGDTAQAIARIRALASDNDLRSKLAAANRQRAATEFTIERMVERYAALYRELTAD